MALNTPLAYREGTVGRFLPRVEYRVVPIPGIAVGGALHVRSPNLMRGYLHYEHPGVLDPPRSECGEGWYHTGDVVDVDAEGFVTMLGRTRRFAKVAGEMVSLDQIERIALRASPQHQHAATLAQLPGSGESTVLFTTDAALDRARLSRAAHELGAQELAIARRVIKVDELPVMGGGKIDYVALRLRADGYLFKNVG
jgi:acyl-[acyl-carrier-protein]-phospholipid O-acyltransferase/long-chain-fatty-acid--[acyl-carrier-protein] ligase